MKIVFSVIQRTVEGGIFKKLTADVQVAHVDAFGNEFQDANIRQLNAPSQFNVSQLGATSAQSL